MDAPRALAVVGAATLVLFSACNRGGEADLARGNLYASKQQWTEAAEAYRAAARATEGPRPRELLGHVLLQAGKKDEARAAYEDAIRMGPEGAVEARVGLARLDVEAGRLQEGLLRLDEAVARDPDNLYALLSRANARLRRGEPEDLRGALADAEGAVERDPSSADALYTRGNVELALGRFDEAGRTFEEVKRRAPERPLAWYGWARLGAARGDRVNALVNLRQARKIAGERWRPEEVLADPAFVGLKQHPEVAEAIGTP